MNGHNFCLIPLKHNCHFKPVNIDFSPPPNLNKTSNSILPVFLNDRKFYTPAFVLRREKEYFETISPFEKEKFEERILKENRLNLESSEDKSSETKLPLPIPSSSYCQICKKSFSCYPEHIEEVSHLRQSRFSKANKYINQLCRKIKKENNPKPQIKKTKPLKKQSLKTNDYPVQPSKKRKQSRKQKNAALSKYLTISTQGPSAIPTPI